MKKLGLSETPATRSAAAMSEKMLVGILEQLKDGVLVLDRSGVLLHLNNEAAGYFARARSDVQGRPIQDLFSEPEARRFLDAVQQILERGRAPAFSVALAGVRTRRVQISGFPLESLVGFLIRDVTAEHQLRADLAAAKALAQEERARLEAVLAASDDVIFAKDLEGLYLLASPSAARAMGITPGQTDADLFPADIAAKIRADEQRTVQTGRTLRVEEVRPARGGPRPYLTTTSVWRTAHGKVAGIVGIAVDISRRKATEAQLQTSEARLSAIFAQNGAGISLVTSSGQFTMVNDRFCDITGRRRDELLTLRMHDITHPDDLPANAERFEQCAKTGRPFEIEKRYVRPDGSVAWVMNSVSVVQDAAGQGSSIVCVTADVTARVMAEQASRDSESRLRTMADIMPQMIWATDPEGAPLYYNARWESFTGMPPDAIDLAWKDLLHPDDRARARQAWRHSIRTGKEYQIDYRFRTAAGIYRWVLSRALPMRDHTGRITRWIGTCTDIDDHRRAIEALARSEERFRLAQQAARIGFWDTDLRSGRTWWSDSAFQMLGLNPTADGVPRNSPIEAVHPDDRARYAAALQDAARGERPLDGEFRMVRADGSVRWSAIRGEVVKDATDTPVRLVGVSLDVTDRHQAEERQLLLMREVDHRAKNALAVVQSLVRLTAADSLVSYKEAVEGRVAALARAHTLLASNRWSGADLRQVVEGELAAYEGAAERIHISGPPLVLAAEMAQSVELLIHELAINAVKHGALSVPAGTVHIHWRLCADRSAELLWLETGGPEVSPPARSGFGSVLVQTTVQHQLQGEVIFDWAPSGLVATIRLPETVLAPSLPRAAAGGSAMPCTASPDLRGKRILIVEDNALLALDTKMALSRLGAVVVGPVGLLDQACRLACEEQLDAAVLDINLNGDGAAPVATILADRGIPFLFCTGYDQVPAEVQFPDVPVLIKPYRATDLESSLAALLVRSGRCM